MELFLLPRVELERIDLPEGRVYRTPYGDFRSVTTIIGEAKDKKYLDAWHARVGNEEADRIADRAASIGTDLHDALEAHLLKVNTINPINPFIMERYYGITEHLEKHVTKIYGVEFPLWNKTLKTAGTTDLVCEYDGLTTIVDFKTSRRERRKEDILDYFLQATTYGWMFSAMHKMPFEQIVIIMSVEGHSDPIIFLEKDKRKIWEYHLKVRDVFVKGAKI
jgi:PD-(D/E)XK nuclease superfamily